MDEKFFGLIIIFVYSCKAQNSLNSSNGNNHVVIPSSIIPGALQPGELAHIFIKKDSGNGDLTKCLKTKFKDVKCLELREPCTVNSQCCTRECRNGSCGFQTGSFCRKNEDCWHEICDSVVCHCICKKRGYECEQDFECCDEVCNEVSGVTHIQSQYIKGRKFCNCIGVGFPCRKNASCCSYKCINGVCISPMVKTFPGQSPPNFI